MKDKKKQERKRRVERFVCALYKMLRIKKEQKPKETDEKIESLVQTCDTCHRND